MQIKRKNNFSWHVPTASLSKGGTKHWQKFQAFKKIIDSEKVPKIK